MDAEPPLLEEDTVSVVSNRVPSSVPISLLDELSECTSRSVTKDFADKIGTTKVRLPRRYVESAMVRKHLPEVTTLKVLVIGDPGVGKTAFINYYVGGTFHNNYRQTIGGKISALYKACIFPSHLSALR